jgi:hypothetical protein
MKYSVNSDITYTLALYGSESLNPKRKRIRKTAISGRELFDHEDIS